MTDSNGIFQTNQNIGFYLISDQPTTCPKCGCRTEIESETCEPHIMVQQHRCLSASCGFEFLAIEERDGMKTTNCGMISLPDKFLPSRDFLDFHFENIFKK